MFTVSEAQAVNDLLRFIDTPTTGGLPHERVRAAVQLLARGAHHRLHAGITPDASVPLMDRVLARSVATDRLMSVLDDMAPFDMGPALTCTEVDALADFMRASDPHGGSEMAALLLDAHARDDDEGDQHCPHGRNIASRRDNPCPGGLPGCAVSGGA